MTTSSSNTTNPTNLTKVRVFEILDDHYEREGTILSQDRIIQTNGRGSATSAGKYRKEWIAERGLSSQTPVSSVMTRALESAQQVYEKDLEEQVKMVEAAATERVEEHKLLAKTAEAERNEALDLLELKEKESERLGNESKLVIDKLELRIEELQGQIVESIHSAGVNAGKTIQLERDLESSLDLKGVLESREALRAELAEANKYKAEFELIERELQIRLEENGSQSNVIARLGSKLKLEEQANNQLRQTVAQLNEKASTAAAEVGALGRELKSTRDEVAKLLSQAASFEASTYHYEKRITGLIEEVDEYRQHDLMGVSQISKQLSQLESVVQDASSKLDSHLKDQKKPLDEGAKTSRERR